ncbi:hypothetical protein [Streptomyces sp. IBSBF 3136]|uniref:hypothetical protein n=1 Tax=Streptomyces sp. IBSBF 3136 TaxID=2903524 RepID=UPI002FDC766E
MSDEDPSSRSEGRGERSVIALDRRLPVASAGKQFPRKAFPDDWSFPPGEPAPGEVPGGSAEGNES